jgi:hypothetical protein
MCVCSSAYLFGQNSDFEVAGGVLVKYNGAGGNVTIPANLGITKIGERAFLNCKSLTSVTIPKGVTAIEKEAFGGCTGLTSGTVPSSITNIGDSAFYNCEKLASVNLQQGLTAIGKGAFNNCKSLASVNLQEGVAAIGDSAFLKCGSLTSVAVPASVTGIGKGTFGECGRLTGILVDAANPSYSSKDKNLFNKAQTLLIQYPAGKTDVSYTIPASVTAIEEFAFANCAWLTSVTIPEGVTSIGKGAFAASGLTSVTLPASVTDIDGAAFALCFNLTSATIPEGVTCIEQFTFTGCFSLTSVTIPEGVTSIERYAFQACGLVSATIPASVTDIGDAAFQVCINLTSIHAHGKTPPNLARLGAGTGTDVFDGVNKTSCVLYVPEGSQAAYRAADGWKDFLTISTSNAVIEAADVRYANGILSIHTLAAERIDVYSVNGALRYQAQKASGEATFPLHHLPRGVLIVKGSSGWTKKIVKQ